MKKMITVISMMLIVLMMSVGISSAQAECPAGLTDDECTLLNNSADATINGATSFGLTFDNATVIVLGELLELTLAAEGTGEFQMADGIVTAADIVMPTAEGGFGGMMGSFLGNSGTGAASFTLVDGVMYFGAGETVDDREFSSITLADYPNAQIDLSFTSMGGSFTADLPDTEWTTSSVDGATVFTAESSFDLNDPAFIDSVVSGEAAGLITGLVGDGLLGDATISATITVDPATGFLLGLNTATTINFDLEALAEQLGEDGDFMADMLTGEGSVSATLNATFTDYNTPVEVSAPAAAEEMDSFTADSTLSTASDGIPALISGYFSTLATASDLGGGAGGGTVNNMYFGNCTTDQRTYIEGGTIGLGESVTGTLAEGQAVTWTFNGQAGEIVSIGMNSTPLDPYLELLDAEGSGIAGNDDFTGLDSRIEGFVLPADGTYTIVACTYDGTDAGEYTLILEPSDTAAGAAPGVDLVSGAVDNDYFGFCTPADRTHVAAGTLSADTPASGTLAEGEAATWTFNGRAGDSVTIALDSPDFDTRLELVGPDGTGVAGNDDFGGTFNSQITDVPLPVEGEYTVVACGFSSFDSGAYNLNLTLGG